MAGYKVKDIETREFPVKDETSLVGIFLKKHAQYLELIREMTAEKNHDYTAGDADPYANFMAVEKFGITTAEVGLLTRMTDKWMRIVGMVKNGEENRQVKDESFKDTCLDMANYLVLLALVHDEKGVRNG